MPDVYKTKYFYRGRSQNWKTWKFRIFTPCARVKAYRHQKYILQFQKWFQQLRHMPLKCPCPNTNPLAQTVYPLQSSKVHLNFENKKNCRKKFLSPSTTTRKTRWIHWWNPFLNPLTTKGDICNFVTAVSALSNTSQRSVYNYARRPILRTGQHLPCAAFSSCCMLSLTKCHCSDILIEQLMAVERANRWHLAVRIGSSKVSLPQRIYKSWV